MQDDKTQNPPPRSSPELLEALNEVDKLSELKDDWDDEGGKAPSEPVRAHAKALLCGLDEALWIHSSEPLSMPSVSPGPGDTIDLLWSMGKRELLMNVTAGRAAYVGIEEVERGTEIKGVINQLEALTSIAIWLRK